MGYGAVRKLGAMCCLAWAVGCGSTPASSQRGARGERTDASQHQGHASDTGDSDASQPGVDAAVTDVDAAAGADDGGLRPDATPDDGGLEPLLNVTPELDQARAVHASVAAALGATLEATDAQGVRYTLTIADTALLDDVEITMTPIAALHDLPFDGLVSGVQLEPEGLQFVGPVALQITRPNAAPDAHLIGVSYHGNGASLHLEPLALPPDTLQFDLLHFSGYGVVARERCCARPLRLAMHH